MGQLQQASAGGGALSRVEAGHGVEQGQALHSLRGLAHDLEGDVATHGQRRQGEAGRGLVKYALGHGADAVVTGEVGDLYVHLTGQRGGLLCPEALIVEQARQLHQGGGIQIHGASF
ncbi:hypothetical protein FQZ97_1169550 [compost metagenome]